MTPVLAFTDDFDSDVVGNDPSDTWYTYTEDVSNPGNVSDTEADTAPNSFKHNTSASFKPSYFTLNIGNAVFFVNFSLFISSSSIHVTTVYLFNGTSDIGLLATNWDGALYELKDGGGTIVTTLAEDTWYDISFCMNWTTNEYTLTGNGFTGAWCPFSNPATKLTKITMSNVLAGIDYYDDLEFVYSNYPPEASAISPVDNSSCNPSDVDFSIQEWDNDSVDPINSTVYLYIWDGLTWDYVSQYYDSVADGDYHNGTFSGLCDNRTYGWNVNLTSDGTTVILPLSGYHVFNVGCDNMSIEINGYNSSSQAWDDLVETDSLDVVLTLYSPNASIMAFSDDGISWSTSYAYDTTFDYTMPCSGNGLKTIYCRFLDACGYFYCNDTIIVNGTAPNITISYPVEDATYTSVQWGASHDLVFTGATDESFVFDINVTSEDFYTFLADDVDYVGDTIDLEPYVWFDDQNYTITLNVSNCFGYQILTVNFTTGDPLTDLAKHISLKGLSPERENFSQLELLEQGVMFDITCTEPNGILYRFYLTDWDGNVMNEQDDITILDTVNGWQSKGYYSGRFYSRSFYKSWVGISNATSDVQFDDLYGYASIQYMSFTDMPLYHYVFNNSQTENSTDEGRYQIIPGIFYGENATIYDSFTGIEWGFGTYAPGDVIPFHSIGDTLYDRKDIYDSNWIQKFEKNLPGISYVMGFMVILFFALMPILITHTFPPIIIELFFTEMGMVIAYAMGVFPIWIFELILIALLMAIFYKVFSWYRERSGVTNFADTPLVKGGIKNITYPFRKSGLRQDIGKTKEILSKGRPLLKDTGTSQPVVSLPQKPRQAGGK